tara:strand:- start:18 stop:428 length:411 start_codon:yes stop_codon:yes gene_type:complete
MLELLQVVWDLVLGVCVLGVDLVSLIASFGWKVLHHIHVELPRLEGLLVGIGLAWLMVRRDRHPLLRVLSSPLKLVVDILDLAWDQCVEVVRDCWAVATGWVRKVWALCWGVVKGVGSRVMGLLTGLRDRLLGKRE